MWKNIIAAMLASLVLADADCPVDRQTMCVDDFKEALPQCKKAAQEKGKDFDADIICLKYFATVQKDCWPCICYIAEKEKLNVRGC